MGHTVPVHYIELFYRWGAYIYFIHQQKFPKENAGRLKINTFISIQRDIL